MFGRQLKCVWHPRVRKSVKIVIEIRFCPAKREASAIVDRSIDKAQCVQGLRSIDDALPNIELLADIAQERPTIREYTRSFYRLDSTMHRLWDGPLSRVRPSVITMSALVWPFVLLLRPHCVSTVKFFSQCRKNVLNADLSLRQYFNILIYIIYKERKCDI